MARPELTSVLALLFLSALVCASAEDLFHSLDGGVSFSLAGSIEGKLNRGEAVVVRTAASESELAQLQALAEQDGFYTVRVGAHVTASVRASCFAAPANVIHERLTLAMAHGRVVGISYIVSSPACGVHVPAGTPVQLPARTLTVDVLLPAAGPQLLADRLGQQRSGPVLTNPTPSGAGAGGAGKQRTGGGPASRPVGGMPTTVIPTDTEGAASEGGEAPVAPPPEQSWLQKNWLFIAGGVMVALNVLTASGRQAVAPAGGAAAGGAGGGGARRS